MAFRIVHRTHYRYAAPVSDSFTSVRMQPRGDGGQRLVEFNLRVMPASRVWSYRDGLGNVVHHFSLAAPHTEQTIEAQAVVEVLPQPRAECPPADSWAELRALRTQAEWWDWFQPSGIARPSIALNAFRDALNLRSGEPGEMLESLNRLLPQRIRYEPGRTQVDSPLDTSLTVRAGVCQDFAHLFITLARGAGIPARYVSGYLFHREEEAHLAHDATHAWAEAFIPGRGWVGFDPSNGLMAGPGHIRVAIGRDYADVPPTRGVYRGAAQSELAVSVQVAREPDASPDLSGSTRMSELQAEVVNEDEGAVLRLAGVLGAAELGEFERAVDRLPKSGGRVAVDLSGLKLLTSAGLGALVRLQNSCAQRNCIVRLAAVPHSIAQLLRNAALDRVFNLAPTVADALA